MSLVMQPIIIKDEVKQETTLEQSNPVKIPIPVDAQLVSQAKSIVQSLSAAAATSTSSSSTSSNNSQQGSSASISNQQPTISAPTQPAPATKTNIIQSALSTTPTLKSQKSFNPTDSFLSSFTTPPVNPTAGNNNGIGSSSTLRMGSNSIGSGSIFSSLTAPFKPTASASANPQTIITSSSNTSTSSSNSANTLGESADVANFTNHIFSQPYLFYQSNNMSIPQLEASSDDLYTVFTFIVPNKPYPNTSTNSQLQKNNSSSSSNNNNPSSQTGSSNGNTGSSTSNQTGTGSMTIIGNNAKTNGAYTSYNSSNTLNSLSSNSNTPVIQHSSLLSASSQLANSNNTTTNGSTPNGFQKSGEGSITKSHRNSFSSTSTTPKVPHFGLASQGKEERKSSQKGQSLVDLIKQQCNPEDEKRKKSDSVPTFTNLGSGFKSNFNSSSNLGSLTQLPMGGLSQSSITSLLNLSLNPMNNNANNTVSGFNPINSTNFGINNSSQNNNDAMESEDALLFLQQQIKQEQQQMQIKQELLANESQSQLNAIIDEEEEKVVMPDSNDDDDDECDEEGDDDDDKKSGEDSGNEEDEEARLIREIKEMKKKKAGGQSMFAKNFKKDGGFLFGGEGQEGDIFDFCEEKLGGGGKKQKKNGSGGHKNKFDTKNLVKNFLNSFISFAHHPDEEAAIIDVLGFESSPQLNDFRSNLRNFFKGKKFNRVLLKEFIFEDLFRPLFLFFLENRALIWIESGRMKDKASHLRALKNFIFVCQNYDQIKSWRFRYNFVQN